LLEKRLAEIVNPTNTSQDRTASLRIIDSFLAKRGDQDALKQAIRIVKPFFLAVYDEKLQHEASRVLQGGFSAHENAGAVLERYLLNLAHPGKLQRSETLRKLARYHDERERIDLEERLSPERSRDFAYRELLSVLGVGVDPQDPSMSLAEREKIISENTKDHLLAAGKFMECTHAGDKAVDEELIRRRE